MATITFQQPPAEKTNLKVGQHWLDTKSENRLYVIADFGNQFTLVNIARGSTYCGLCNCISSVFGGDDSDFILIDKPFTVEPG